MQSYTKCIYELIYPETLVPASLIKEYFPTNCFATWVQKSLFGWLMWAYIVETRSRTIAFRMSGVSLFRCSASPSPLIAYIIPGLHVSGIENFFMMLGQGDEAAEENEQAEETEAVS